MQNIIIGTVVVIVILIIIYLVYINTQEKERKRFSRNPNTTFVHEMAVANQDNEHVRYLGNASSMEQCEDMCYNRPDCKAYTWFGPGNDEFTNNCHGLTKYNLGVQDQQNVHSGTSLSY